MSHCLASKEAQSPPPPPPPLAIASLGHGVVFYLAQPVQVVSVPVLAVALVVVPPEALRGDLALRSDD